jgi:hypothetical protein
MSFIQILVFGFIAAVILRYLSSVARRVATERRQDDFADKFETFLEQAAERIHVVDEEKYSDITYWFDEDDHTFLAQGRDLTEIINVLKSRFPTHIFLLNGGKNMLIGPGFDMVLDVENFVSKQYLRTEQ